jgi:hypothetical protein
MSDVLDFMMPPVVVAAPPPPTAVPNAVVTTTTRVAARPVAEAQQPAARERHAAKTPEPEKKIVSTPAVTFEQHPKQTKQTSRYVIVQFKYETATFLAPFKTTIGDIVVVEGDRGENIGTVAEIQKDAPAFAVVAKVLRRATEKDLAALKAQREREAAATLSTRAVAESLGLHGRVEDAEYQFDLNKLTIFVSRPTKTTFVDFRKLQRTLFREFRCRIWCSYMDEIEAAEAGPRSR